MIKNNVVLVLGAGASQPYGFLSGLGLKREAQSILAHNDQGFRNSFGAFEFNPDYYVEFARALKESPMGSIDAFLEARPKFLDIGKHVIAYLMVQREDPNQLADGKPSDDENWYRYLFNLMTRDGLSGFKENNLKVITYNYDRSFEYFFINGLMSTYGISFDAAEAELRHVPVIHVHGRLGRLTEAKSNESSRPYVNTASAKHVSIAASGIRIIHELREGSSDNWGGFEKAREAIHDARTVVFVGFGYHRDNVSRLLECPRPNFDTVYGTTHGFTQSEVQTLVRPAFERLSLNFHQLRNSDCKALVFIQNNLELFLRD